MELLRVKLREEVEGPYKEVNKLFIWNCIWWTHVPYSTAPEYTCAVNGLKAFKVSYLLTRVTKHPTYFLEGTKLTVQAEVLSV